MSTKVLIISGSPKKNGNTAAIIEWFCSGLYVNAPDIEIVLAAFLKYKTNGCISCRSCQRSAAYECVIDDDAKNVLIKISQADIIVFATPLYFFGPSAQIKLIFDRMFSLYKWDNDAGTMQTPLRGKTLIMLGSAFEDIGLDAFERPFALTAEYTGMKYGSLIIPNAGVSGDIRKMEGIQTKVEDFGKRIISGDFTRSGTEEGEE